MRPNQWSTRLTSKCELDIGDRGHDGSGAGASVAEIDDSGERSLNAF